MGKKRVLLLALIQCYSCCSFTSLMRGNQLCTGLSHTSACVSPTPGTITVPDSARNHWDYDCSNTVSITSPARPVATKTKSLTSNSSRILLTLYSCLYRACCICSTYVNSLRYTDFSSLSPTRALIHLTLSTVAAPVDPC